MEARLDCYRHRLPKQAAMQLLKRGSSESSKNSTRNRGKHDRQYKKPNHCRIRRDADCIWSSASLGDECAPSKWGADDQLGAANYLTPERVLLAGQKGKSRSWVSSLTEHACLPPLHSAAVVQPTQTVGLDPSNPMGGSDYNDDLVQMWLGTGPRWTVSGIWVRTAISTTATRAASFQRSRASPSLAPTMCRR